MLFAKFPVRSAKFNMHFTSSHSFMLMSFPPFFLIKEMSLQISGLQVECNLKCKLDHTGFEIWECYKTLGVGSLRNHIGFSITDPRHSSPGVRLEDAIEINTTQFLLLLHFFFFFVINNFYFYFFHTQHNRISKIKQNKTADTYSTSQGPTKREGEREGQQEHKSHSFK